MKKRYIIIFLIIGKLMAIDLNLPNSAVYTASNNLILLDSIPGAVKINPAVTNSGIELSGKRLFSFQELNKFFVNFAKDFDKYGFGFCLESLKTAQYFENIYNLAFNYNIKNLRVGWSFNLNSIKIRNYDSYYYYYHIAGLKFSLEKTQTHLAFKNVLLTEKYEKEFPLLINYESNYQIFSNFNISVGLEKEKNYPFSLKLGTSFRWKILTFINSCQTKPNRVGLGLKFKINKIEVSYGLRTHEYLDLTHAFSVAYEI